MKAPFFFGYVLGLTIAIPIFKKHDEEGLMSIDLANDLESLKSAHEEDQRITALKLTDPKQHQQENPNKTNKGSIIDSFLNIEHHAILDSNRNQSGIHTQENGIIPADSPPDQKQIKAVMYRYKFMKNKSNNSQHKINISQRDLNIPQSINIDGMPEDLVVIQSSRVSLKKRSTDNMSTEMLYDSNTELGLDNHHISELGECSSNPNSEDIYGDFVSRESSSLTSSNESDIDSDKSSDYIDSKESTSAFTSSESNISRSTENEPADSTDLAPATQANFTVSYVPYLFHSSSESSNLDDFGLPSKLGTTRNSTEFTNNVDSSQSNEQSNSDESGDSKSSSGSAESSQNSNESNDQEQSNDQHEESASELSNNGVDDLFV